MFDGFAQWLGYAVVAAVVWFGGMALLDLLNEKVCHNS